MSGVLVRSETTRHVAVLTLDRPGFLNALSRDLVGQLAVAPRGSNRWTSRH